MTKVLRNKARKDRPLPPNRELELISRIGQNLNSVLDIDQVLTVLLNEVRNLLNISGASIWLLEKKSGDIVCRQAAGVHIEKVVGHRLKEKNGISGWVTASGQSVIVADTRHDSRHDNGVAEKMDIEFRSILSVPLQATGDIIGAIQVVDVTPNRFKIAHRTLLEALAGSATVAIRNARLFRDLNSRTAALQKTNAKLKRVIAQREKAEAELNRYKQQLEKRVKRQTIELDRSWKALASQDEVLPKEQCFGDIIGKSGAMRRIYSLIRNLADVSATVLITGESGTGKEMVASALHSRNQHKDRPFVKVNCSALSDNVLESELFGHVKGAFTGAYKNKIGWFQKAADGTILLDEIGDISPGCQKRLLRVLQEREFERMGDTTTLPMRARIVAATNQNLQDKVKRGEFRQDLYYRLKVVEIRLPSLRRRTEDIPLLIHHFLKTFNRQFDKEIEGLSPSALRLMVTCLWPGNVRELRNTLEYICILCKNRIITKDDLPADFPGDQEDRLLPLPLDTDQPLPSRPLQIDRQTLLRVLEQEQWNKTRAAEVLGISRRTLYRRLKEYQI